MLAYQMNVSAAITPVFATETPVIGTKTPVIVAETAVIVTETRVIAAETPIKIKTKIKRKEYRIHKREKSSFENAFS